MNILKRLKSVTRLTSLRSKVFLISLLPILLTIIISGNSVFRLILENEEKQLQKYMTFVATSQAHHVNLHLSKYLAEFAQIAESNYFKNYRDTFQDAPLSNFFIGRQAQFKTLAVVNRGFALVNVVKGQIVEGLNQIPIDSLAQKAQAVKGEVVYQVALEHHQYTEPVLELALHSKSYYEEDAELILYGVIPLSDLASMMLTKQDSQETVFLTLVTSDLTILFSHSDSKIGVPLDGTGSNGKRVINAVKSHQSLYTRATIFEVDAIRAVSPVGNLPCSILVSLPYDNHSFVAQTLRDKIFINFLLSILIVAFMASFLSRSITTPLEKLKVAAEEVAKGNFGVKTDINTGDEVGALANAFNDMSSRLAEYVTQEKELATTQATLTAEEAQVTLLKKSEKKFRTLTDNIPGMVYRTDSDFIPLLLTGSEAISGYTEEEFYSGEKEWLKIAPSTDLPARITENQELTETPGSTYREYRITHKNGEVRWVADHSTSLFVDGIFQGLDGVVFDITPHKEMESGLIDAKKAAEQ
ncbi:MAG: HAMP domain-containing protein, partial [Desulfocapsa sp.]|nr:HAMP domain-containing protein [Desulfocapsa sp.]